SLFVAHEEHESLRASGLFGMGVPQRSFAFARRISYHVVIGRKKNWQCPKERDTAKRQQGSSRGFSPSADCRRRLSSLDPYRYLREQGPLRKIAFCPPRLPDRPSASRSRQRPSAERPYQGML